MQFVLSKCGRPWSSRSSGFHLAHRALHHLRSICLSNGSSFSVGPVQVQTGRPKLADLLKKGQIKEALALSPRKRTREAIWPVTAAGIQEFLEGKEANLSIGEQVETAREAASAPPRSSIRSSREG